MILGSTTQFFLSICKYGIIFRALGVGFQIMSPKLPVLYSEREGYKRVIKLGFGFRFCFLGRPS